jgi:KUP system potassium uptake protein
MQDGAVERKPSPRGIVALAALGVVFGDIGTDPLYAFRQCFHNGVDIVPSAENVTGVVSLILWSLIFVVSIKYLTFVMRADHDGEGGILALLALVLPAPVRGVIPRPTWLTFLIIIGAGMLFGDGVITPAVSVLSAVEGLKVATSAAEPYVVPITVAVLVVLFLFQSRGTQKIGRVFGPVMIVWFLAIAITGAVGIASHPAVLWAIDPRHVFEFMFHNGFASIVVLGAVVLCVSGVEALYADMSHFGRAPIALAWYAMVFPALVLNFAGQGALVLNDPRALDQPFFALVPGWALYPMVAIATIATVIASQALISGAFTLAEQAIELGFLPRLQITHTSQEFEGQVFLPFINVLLAVVCLTLVITFRSSAKLADAYGLAVAVTMTVTSIGYFSVIRQKFGWKLLPSLALVGAFLAVDLSYVAGSIPKIPTGGWIPLSICVVLFVVAIVWRAGRRRMGQSYLDQSVPVAEFLAETRATGSTITGTAVFMTTDPEGIPFVLRHQWARTRAIHERIVLLTVLSDTQPAVADAERVAVEELAPSLVRVTARFGFMEQPTLGPIVASCKSFGLALDDKATAYFIADPVVVPGKSDLLHTWRRELFGVLLRNSRPLTSTMGIPADQLAKLGLEVAL